MANWIVEKDKNGYFHVREDENGTYKNKDDALEAGKNKAKKAKTVLRVHKVDAAGYDQMDYSSAKSAKELKAAAKEDVAKAKTSLDDKEKKLK